jgi:hypothetical protein
MKYLNVFIIACGDVVDTSFDNTLTAPHKIMISSVGSYQAYQGPVAEVKMEEGRRRQKKTEEDKR